MRVKLGRALGVLLGLMWLAPPAGAFCGFYAGKADATLFNEASQVILVRDGRRTVLSLLNDFQGEMTDFALVIPTPQVLQKGQIHVGDKKVFERLDAYSAPRLAEYFDPNPCEPRVMMEMARSATTAAPKATAPRSDAALGVKVEAEYTVGEYDIVILSAEQSNGLETWLHQSGYKIPKGASAALAPYIRQGMKFFVARVNLKEQAKTGYRFLRPIQFAFESERFMLPIRLGMVNAKGPQDLIVYALTRNGRVEASNYRTIKLPADMDIPTFVRGEFASFYKALFREQAEREGLRAVFTEYFWDMGWCDPCAADPLSVEELRAAGVFWVRPGEGGATPQPLPGRPRSRILPPGGGAQPVMLTRLHVRYTPDTFPEDLMFHETADRQNYQARYVLRHPWKGEPNACPEAAAYLAEVQRRQEREAHTLANLTGWPIGDIYQKMQLKPAGGGGAWWEDLWRQ